MALSDKDIIITPNKSQTADPKIEFRGADSSTGAQTITVKAYPTNGGTLSFEGSSGQLFAVTNSLTGTLFSVNDISGVPSIEVLDTGFVKLAQYGGTVGIGVSTSAYTDKLQIANADSTGIRFTGSNATITSNYNLIGLASNNLYLRPGSGYSVIIDTGNGLSVTSGNITWASGSQNNGNPRSLAIGYSGGNYGQAGYGITFTGTSGLHNYAINDIVSLWEAYDGIRVLAAAAGTVGTAITWTTVLDARRSNSALTFKGNTVLDSNNYNSYSPTLTGTGASGTWGISITGNAATATKWQTARSITIGNVGRALDGSADLTWTTSELGALSNSTSSTQDGYFGDIYLYDDSTPSHHLRITNSGNLTASNRVLSIDVNDAARTVSLSGNLTVSANATISGTNTGDQTTVSGNAGTATTWQTARTLTIGATGKSVNGSADVSWSASEIGLTSYLPLAGGTLTGALTGTSINTSGNVGIGMGATAPSNRLHIQNTTTQTAINANDNQFLIIENVTNAQCLYGIGFKSQNGFTQAGIFAFSGTNGGANGDLRFYTRNTSSVLQENMRLSDAGVLTVGGNTVLNAGNYTSYVGNGTLTLNTNSGSGLSGSASFTANQSGNVTFTVTSNATANNTASTIMLRGSSNEVYIGDVYSSQWFRNYGTAGLYNQDHGNHWYATGNDYWNLAGNNASNIGIILRSGGHQGTIRGYVYADSNNHIGFLNNGGSWRLRVVSGDYTLAEGSSIRGQLFYDSNDTNYYIDPASTSILNRLNVAGYTMRSSATLDMSNTGVYSTSNYYPVTIPVSAMAGSYAMPVRMRILNSLNSNVPSWSTHGSGFTCHIEWTSNGSGWGTIGINRTIHRYTEAYTNSTICGGITQMTNGSIEVIWLRGGGIYYFEADANVTPTIQSTTYTDNGQSVTPTSSAQNDVWSSATTTMSLGHLKTNNTITAGGTATFNGNVNLGSSNGNITRVNDILRLGASDSGDSEFLFGEDTSGWYGSRWYWDSSYTHYWYSRNAGTDTELMRFVTNDWNSPLYISRSTYITGGTSNNANDATLYVTADNDNDWAMIINKYRSAATNYGLQILVASADNYALGVYGNGNTLNFRVGGDGQVRASGNIFAPGFYNNSDTATRFVNGNLFLRSSAPTVYFRDTDNRSAMIHVNSNIFYVLRGNGTDSESWATVNGAWPLELNLENNNASIGGALYVGSTLSSSDIYMGDTDEGQRRIHNNSNRIGFLNDSNGWGSWCADSGYWQSDQSVRSPLFYDSSDTNFYVDPATLGSTASIVSGRFNISGNHNYSSLRVYLPSANNGANTGTVSLQMWCSEPGNTWDGAGFGYNVDNNDNNGGSAPAYYFGRVNTSLGQSYMRFLSGGDWYFYNTNTSGTRTQSLGLGSDGIFYAYNQIRTPVIYDYNDTNYYIDPASTSRVNTISFVSGATFGPYLQYSNTNNLRIQGGSNSTEVGLVGYDFNGNWRFQLYGGGSGYGFLNGNWAGWDIQKVTSGNLYLNNQTTYYIGTSEIYYNRVYGLADIRSPLFYDNDNTAYYCNPAGTSQFLQLDVVNSIGASDDVRSGTRMYDSAGMAAGVGGQLVLGYKYTTTGTYTEGAILKTYKINATDGNYGSGLKIQVRNHGENLATKVQIDGSGNMVIGGNMTNNSYDSVGSTRLLFGGGNDPNSYFIGTNLNNYGGNYTKLDLRWHTGIRMGARPGYGGIRIFSDETVGTRIASFGETDSHVRIDNNLYVGQIIDISNSTYYVDPASSSRLNGGIQLDGSLGVGTAGSGTAGEIRATNNITAYYSDDRLKTKLGIIENPIEKVKSLSGFYFEANETAVALGYQKKREVGVSAQEVQAILPEIIAPAPIDEQYMTVRYEKLIPLLIEAIKEQQKQIEELKSLLSNNK